MRITGNISRIEQIVRKGQPFAKRNKDRQIRAELRTARITENNLMWADVWEVFTEWIRQKRKGVSI